MGNRDPSSQYNIEYRVGDATANPYLALTAIVRAGIEGLRSDLAAPPIFSGDPEHLSADERSKLGLRRLPQSLPEAISELKASEAVLSWFAPQLIESFVRVKSAEVEHCAALDPVQICELYGSLY
jgi:glutamine synthetase